jgi:hypothetical protein
MQHTLTHPRTRASDDCEPTRAPGPVMLTLPLIMAGLSRNGYFSDAQLACLGLHNPLGKGWKRRLIGTYISVAAYDRFLALTNAHLPPETIH